MPSRFPLTLKSTTIWKAPDGYDWEIQKQLQTCSCLLREVKGISIPAHSAVQVFQGMETSAQESVRVWTVIGVSLGVTEDSRCTCQIKTRQHGHPQKSEGTRKKKKPTMMPHVTAHAYNLSTQEAEAEVSVPGHLGYTVRSRQSGWRRPWL